MIALIVQSLEVPWSRENPDQGCSLEVAYTPLQKAALIWPCNEQTLVQSSSVHGLGLSGGSWIPSAILLLFFQPFGQSKGSISTASLYMYPEKSSTTARWDNYVVKRTMFCLFLTMIQVHLLMTDLYFLSPELFKLLLMVLSLTLVRSSHWLPLVQSYGFL